MQATTIRHETRNKESRKVLQAKLWLKMEIRWWNRFDQGSKKSNASQSALGRGQGKVNYSLLKSLIKRLMLLTRRLASNKHRENCAIFSTCWCSVCYFKKQQALLFFEVFLIYIAISRNMSYWQQNLAEKLSMYRLWISEGRGLLSLCPWHTAQAWHVFVK